MRAVLVDRWMQPAELRVRDVPEPPLGPGQVDVEVRAAGVNFADILMVQGRYQEKPAFPFVLGAELAGVVRATGEGVRDLEPGDRVFGAPGTGGFAERAVVPAAALHAVPAGLDFPEAAALPIVYPTAYAALVFRAGLRAGETLVVHAAAGATGLAAVQLGHALDARVIATAGGADKLAAARDAGADVTVDYREEDFAERVRAETDGRGADVIFDPVGGDVFDRSLRCLAWNGRLLVVGFASGRIPEVRMNRILLRNVSLVGVHWPAYAQHQPELVAETFAALFALAADGRIRPHVHARYALEELPRALAELGDRRTIGKLVVVP